MSPDPVKKFFDAEVDSYSSNFDDVKTGTNYLFRTRLNLVLELAGRFSGRLLDCGVGSGEIAAAVLSRGNFTDATLVDISEGMLQRTRLLMESSVRDLSLHFVCSDTFEFLDACRESFDLIFCLGMIAHTGRLNSLLSKIAANLSPGGCLLLQTTLLEHWGTKLVRLYCRTRYAREKGYSLTWYRHRDIVDAVNASGLCIESVHRYCVSFPMLDRILPRVNYQVERVFAGWASRHGAEAIYLIRNRNVV